MARGVSTVLLLLAIGAGTVLDRPRRAPAITLGGYRVIAADFHIHSSMWSDGALTPWGLVLEAERQGLDAIAVTGHNEVVDAYVARWFARRVGGPEVLIGQEIMAPGHHVIAVGIDHVVDRREPVVRQIDAVHTQGGVAIAAHPLREFWPGFDADAMQRLDGTEVCHPVVYGHEGAQAELTQFAARADLAAIGSSDFHGLGRMGVCRTYVFAKDASDRSILEALRAHRTVVYGPRGQTYGDPTLARLAAADGRLPQLAAADVPSGWLDWLSRLCGLVGLLGLVLAGPATGRVARARASASAETTAAGAP